MTPIAYLVRHGEIQHHHDDLSLTPRGREQAAAAAAALAGRLADADEVHTFYSPVTRVRETAEVLHARLAAALGAGGGQAKSALPPPRPAVALCNPRFTLGPGREPEEPSLLYEEMNRPGYMESLSAQRAAFYRGFWSSADPMGYWLTHDSDGGSESPADVFNRLQACLGDILLSGENGTARRRWVLVSHSGTIRTLLRQAFGRDPGELDFCEIAAVQPTGAAGEVLVAFRDLSGRVNLAPLEAKTA